MAEPQTTFTDADRRAVSTMTDLLLDLRHAERSRTHTVQVMPDGVEIIEAESGDLVKKIVLTEAADLPVREKARDALVTAVHETDAISIEEWENTFCELHPDTWMAWSDAVLKEANRV